MRDGHPKSDPADAGEPFAEQPTAKREQRHGRLDFLQSRPEQRAQPQAVGARRERLRDDIETLQFNFDDAAALTASAVGSQLSAPAPEVQHTSVAHEITPRRAQARHATRHPRRHSLASNADHRPSEPVELQPAAVEPSFGAPTAQAIGLTQPPAPQADGIGGPTESIDESNLEDLYDHLYRDSDDWGGGATSARRLPAELRPNSGALPQH